MRRPSNMYSRKLFIAYVTTATATHDKISLSAGFHRQGRTEPAAPSEFCVHFYASFVRPRMVFLRALGTTFSWRTVLGRAFRNSIHDPLGDPLRSVAYESSDCAVSDLAKVVRWLPRERLSRLFDTQRLPAGVPSNVRISFQAVRRRKTLATYAERSNRPRSESRVNSRAWLDSFWGFSHTPIIKTIYHVWPRGLVTPRFDA